MQPVINPLSPVDIPGLQLWVTPNTVQNATSGSASGSPVLDASQVTPGGTQGTSGNQPTITFPKFGNQAAFSWNGTSQVLDYGNIATGPLCNITNGSYSFAFAFNSGPTGNGNYQTLLSKSAGGDSRILFTVNALRFIRNNNLVSFTMQPNTPYAAVYIWQKLTATTGNEFLYLNGQLAAQNLGITIANADTVHSVQVGGLQGGSFNGLDIYHICGWNIALSNAQMLSISNYFLKSMGYLVNLVMEGNSLVAGTGASNLILGHASLLGKMLQADVVFNFGVGGSRFIDSESGTVGMITRSKPFIVSNLTNNITRASMPAVDFNILIAWESTNAFWRDNVSVQANIEDTYSYFQIAQSLGYMCGTATGPYMGAPAEASRLAYNAWMRANWGNFADFLVDYGGDMYLNQAGTGGIGQSGYNEFFGSNAPHPNNLGHARMANIANRDTLKFMKKRSQTLPLQ